MLLRWRSLALYAAAFVCTTCSHSSHAAWEVKSGALPLNTDTTLSLQLRRGESAESASHILWLSAADPESLIVPETVQVNNGTADVSVFARKARPELLVYDESDESVSTISLATSQKDKRLSWRPKLHLLGIDGQPTLLANQEGTPTLTLEGGEGLMPPSAYLSVTDHRGRLVYGRFHSTFDLLGGMGKVKVPAAGLYQMSVRLLDDELTSLPRAAQRDAEVVPFGVWVEREKAVDPAKSDFVTTSLVVGSIVSLEHIPTTASLLLEDRLRMVVLGQPSKESRLNRWPYMLNGAGVQDLSVREYPTMGAKRLQWQELLGSTFGPVKVEWSDLQLGPGSFRWAKLVDILPLYRRNRVRPIVTINGRSWNGSIPTETSETLAAWVDLSREVSEKFGKLIWGYHVYPQPQKVWSGAAGVVEYGKLLKETWTGYSTRDGSKVQAAPIISGAMGKGELSYLKDLLHTEAGNVLGGVAISALPADAKKSPAANDLESTFDAVKSLLRDSGKDNLPVWLLEAGWPNGPDGVTRDLQANYLVRTHTMALARGFYKIGWNSLIDKSLQPWEGAAEKRMGLLTADYRVKPAAVAYNVMTFLMSGITPKDEAVQGKARVFAFNIGLQNNKWPGLLYVAWTESPHETQDVLLKMTQGGGVYAQDYLGAEVPAEKIEADPESPLKGKFRFPVGFEPVFIWDAGKPGSSSNSPNSNQSNQD